MASPESEQFRVAAPLPFRNRNVDRTPDIGYYHRNLLLTPAFTLPTSRLIAAQAVLRYQADNYHAFPVRGGDLVATNLGMARSLSPDTKSVAQTLRFQLITALQNNAGAQFPDELDEPDEPFVLSDGDRELGFARGAHSYVSKVELHRASLGSDARMSMGSAALRVAGPYRSGS